MVDEGEAAAGTRAGLASTGDIGLVSADGSWRIRITVTITGRTLVLSLVGIDAMTLTAPAVAWWLTGVAGPGT